MQVNKQSNKEKGAGISQQREPVTAGPGGGGGYSLIWAI